MTLPQRPARRDGFQIGVICALSLEAEMVELVFDKRYKKEESYGKAHDDTNTYTTGAIAGHNVVLAYCPGMGGIAAAQVASNLKRSFSAVEIVFVVGICGVAPFYKHGEIVLGDCIISTDMIQSDFGRIGPGGQSRRQGLEAPGRAAVVIRSLQAKLQTKTQMSDMIEDLGGYLQLLQKEKNISYPGAKRDHLYEANYVHTHPTCPECEIDLGLCKRECADIGCSETHLIQRQRLQQDASPQIHFGAFSSSNQVIKSGKHRDAIAKSGIIAFEMEAAGVWEIIPTIIIKAACDYADSHKNKKWQGYAAAVAAASLKAVLGVVEASDLPGKRIRLVWASSQFTEFTERQSLARSLASGNEAISKADAAIRKYYKSSNRLYVERLSGAKLPLDKCYINLALVDRALAASQQKESFYLKARLRIAAETIGKGLSVEKLFESQRLSNGMTGIPRRIFIQGRAGVGKTTLCKKLVHEFLQGRLGSALFDRLLWIPLRRLKERQPYSWSDLLQDAYALHEPSWRQNYVQYSEQFYETSFLDRTLLLFDGLDEISHGWREDNQFYEFLASIICDSPNIIITSRPQAKTFDPGSFDMELETTGFLPDQIDTYLHNCITRDDTIRDMKSFMDARPFVQSLLRIPIQLDAFCCTWPAPREIPDSSILEFHGLDGSQLEGISTMTTLYHAISLELCRKDLGQLQLQARPREMSDFEITQALTNEMTFMGELAWQGMWNNIIEYQPKYYDRIGMHASKNGAQLSTPYSSILDRLSFLRTSDIEQHPSKRNYHFLHLTFQEFFAARHFVAHWIQDTALPCLDLQASPQTTFSPVQFLQSEKYNPRYNIFWRFVTGLIQLQAGISHEHKPQHDVCAFFALLEGDPMDIVGFTHRRLLMVCLSEILNSQDPDILKLRQRLESFLHSAITEKDQGSADYSIISEPEFPEAVLRQSRAEGKRVPGKPQAKSSSHLDPTLALTGSGPSLERRTFAASLACQHWVGDPQKLLLLVTPLLLEVGKDEKLLCQFKISRLDYIKSFDAFTALSVAFLNKEERIEIRRALGAMLYSLSPQPDHVGLLIAILVNTNEDTYIRQCAGRFLWDLRGSLDDDMVASLVASLSKENPLPRDLAPRPLRYQDLSSEAIATISDALKRKEEGDSAQIDALRVLWASCSLFRPTTACISLIKDKQTPLQLRKEAMHHLRNPALDDNISEVLKAVALDSNEEHSIRGHAFRLLLEYRILSGIGLATLIKLIETGDRAILSEMAGSKVSGGKVIGGKALSPMPELIGNTMIQALRNEKTDAPSSILDLSWWQGFTLSQSMVKTMVEVMRRKGSAVRMSTAIALARQPHCSAEDALRLASTADEPDNQDKWKGHYNLMATLHDRDIYYAILDPGIRLWKSLYAYWRSSGYLYGICCYQLEGLLYLWFGGTRHQITSAPEHSRKLLDAIGKGEGQAPNFKRRAVSLLSLGSDQDSGYMTESGDEPGSATEPKDEHNSERKANPAVPEGSNATAEQAQPAKTSKSRWRSHFAFMSRD